MLLVALVLGAVPLRALAQAQWLGTYVWSIDDPDFGGFSGLDLMPNGRDFVAISDRAFIVAGSLQRQDGQITGVDAGPLAPLLNGRGRPLHGAIADSEGLAVALDGTRYISFEGTDPRVRREGRGGLPDLLTPNPAFLHFPYNASLEALAIGSDGALYTIPERTGRFDRPYPVFRLRDGVWETIFEFPRVGSFVVSGADIGPDGLLYVLERDFSGIGFRSRVRRFGLDGTGGETLLETWPLIHDNLEGIAVWHDGTSIRITMISDDNFNPFQRTEIVEYRVAD